MIKFIKVAKMPTQPHPSWLRWPMALADGPERVWIPGFSPNSSPKISRLSSTSTARPRLLRKSSSKLFKWIKIWVVQPQYLPVLRSPTLWRHVIWVIQATSFIKLPSLPKRKELPRARAMIKLFLQRHSDLSLSSTDSTFLTSVALDVNYQPQPLITSTPSLLAKTLS